MNQISSDVLHLSPLKQALLALENMKSRLKAFEQAQTEAIAIVGMGCRFPGGADDPESFWQLLQDGVDATSEIPADRWRIDAYYDADPDQIGKMYMRRGGFLAEVDQFDADFFGIAPREAISLDPQQRLLLEVSWEALEQAGITPGSLLGSQSGVFIGINNNDYAQLHVETGSSESLDAYGFTGNTFSVAAGRLAYLLGLQGPALALDTACSSSLVAVHLACQSLRAGECRMALAGGVNLILSPRGNLVLSRMRALSPDGRCKTFDQAADGYGRGEGCGVVVLKRLSDAIADGDPILALIRGSAVNHDGRSSGLTAPNGLAQQALIRAALAHARVEPHQISYIEVHGTGTALGDPIEVEALAAALCHERPRDNPLTISSVKTNIGHLEAAAGIAGLIKVVLALQHKQLPPHLHLNQLNSAISWDELSVRIPTELTPWVSLQEDPRLAGVSSFGMSGTNAHLILAEPHPMPAPRDSTVDCPERPLHLLTLSAKNQEALRALAARYTQYLEIHPDASFADIGFTTNTGRSHFSHRLVILAASSAEAHQKLEAFGDEATPVGLLQGSTPHTARHKVAFLFTGQGSQYVGMGRQLYDTQPTFRRVLDQCDEILRDVLDAPLLAVIYPDLEEQEQGGELHAKVKVQNADLNQTVYTQPALFALEYALAQLWMSCGVQPDVVMGHSVGEYVAACIAGVFSLEEGLNLVAERGRLMQALPSSGAMAAVFANEAQVKAEIAPYGDEIAIAAINGPKNTVISGRHAAMRTVLQRLNAAGIEARSLPVSHAFHSPLMEPMLEAFRSVAMTVQYSPPSIPVISNVTGAVMRGYARMQAEYWCRHIHEPVRFAASLQTLQEQGCNRFVEIGPHPTLMGMGRLCLPDEAGIWLPSLRRNQTDWSCLLTSLAILYGQGGAVNWLGFDQDYSRCRVSSLPTYPFQRSRYWLTLPEHKAEHISTNALSHDWFYTLQWQSQRRPLTPQMLTPPTVKSQGTWLIFADRNWGLSTALTAQFQERGQTCVLIFARDTYGVDSAGRWHIDPTCQADYQRLLQDIQMDCPIPCQGVIYLWGLDSAPIEQTTEVSLQHDQVRCCQGALYLIQAIAVAELQPTRLWLITQNAQSVAQVSNDGTDAINITQAPLWGLGRVISLEHPERWGGLIDLDLTTMSLEVAAAALFNELWRPEDDNQIVLRDHQRYVARLVHQPSPLVPLGTVPLTAEGTYLITGGLGGLGLQLTQWLIDQGARHLVLVGRRAPSGSTEQYLRQLEATGAHITVAQADVTHAQQVTELLDEIAQTLPPLKGILHLAGVLDDGVLLRQDWQRFANVMAPKVLGAWNLHTQTHGASLDFFILFSSVASLLGSPGQGNYAAANAFLDALAQYRRGLGLPALSINWSPWGAVGMAAALGDLGEQRWTALGLTPIELTQGFDILARLLQSHQSQIGVLPVDWSVFLQQFPSQAVPSWLRTIAATLPITPKANTPQSSASELLQQFKRSPVKQHRAIMMAHLQQQIAIALGRDSAQNLDPQLGFFEMGLDSLMALDFKNRLQNSLGQPLSSTLTFEYPTLDALADYLLDQVSELRELTRSTLKTPSIQPDLLETVAAIKQLSEDELATLIDRELDVLGARQ